METNLDEIEVMGSPDIGFAMHQWHGSMWDPVYGVGSCFVARAPTTAQQVVYAIEGMEERLVDVRANPQNYDFTDPDMYLDEQQTPEEVELEVIEILEHLRARLWVSVGKATAEGRV